MNLDEKGQEQSKAGADAFEPDVIIDVLIGELEAAGLGGRPRYRFEAEGEGVGLGFETAGKYVV